MLKGFNFRMEGIQGAVLRVKLRHLEAWTEARRGRGPLLRRGLRRQRRRRRPGSRSGRAATSITSTRSAARTRARLAAGADRRKGIQTGIHYPIPVHLQPAYADPRWKRGRLPAFREGRERSAVAADVSRTADRVQQDAQSSPLCWN